MENRFQILTQTLQIQMKRFNWIISISRPRFWSYLAGPWAVGMVSAANSIYDFQNILFWFGLLFFLWPANFLLYGINDYTDRDTDKFNPKKKDYEKLYEQRQNIVFWSLLSSLTVICVAFAWLIPNFYSRIIFGLWIILSFFYSLKPLRFKSRVFLDSISNVLYILPGILVFLIFQPLNNLSVPLVFAAWIWAMGMHLFSSLPDIDSDKKAKLNTTAVWLGFKKASLLTLFYFGFSIVICSLYLSKWIGLFAFFSYFLPTIFIIINPKYLFFVYKMFPVINIISGAVIFIYIYFQ